MQVVMRIGIDELVRFLVDALYQHGHSIPHQVQVVDYDGDELLKLDIPAQRPATPHRDAG